jgi:hypothetical protein
MAIDNPLDAAANQIQFDDMHRSHVLRFVNHLARLGELVPWGSDPAFLATKAATKVLSNAISRRESENREYLLRVLLEEVKSIQSRIGAFSEERAEFAQHEFLPLVIDAFQKAEQVRNTAKLNRIAAILAHSYEVGTPEGADVAEEMMRIALILSDDDIFVLRTVYDGLCEHYNPSLGMTDFHRANDFWRLTDAQMRSASDPEVRQFHRYSRGTLIGICAKLESVGLLSRVEREDMKLSPEITPYTIITRTVQFIEYVGRSN